MLEEASLQKAMNLMVHPFDLAVLCLWRKKYLEKHTRRFTTEFLIIQILWGIKYEQIKCIVKNKDIFLYLLKWKDIQYTI